MKLVSENTLLVRLSRAMPPDRFVCRRGGRFHLAVLQPIDDLEAFARSLGVLQPDEELELAW